MSINTLELLIEVLIKSNTAYPAGLERKSVIKMPLNSYVAFISKSPKEKEMIKKLKVLTFATAIQYNLKCLSLIKKMLHSRLVKNFH